MALIADVLLGVAAFVTLAVLAAVVVAALWPWRVEGSLKATTEDTVVSLAGGLSALGVSASAAAILGGPGVVAVHFRSRERWRRVVPHVSFEALLAWLEEPSPPEKPPGRAARIVTRAKHGLLARTDTRELPGLGLEVLRDLREPSLQASLLCGFEDPTLTGKAAAILFPLAAVLSPFGTLSPSFDWSGRTVIDGSGELAFGVVPAKVLREVLRFGWRHVHLRRKPGAVSSTLAVSSPT